MKVPFFDLGAFVRLQKPTIMSAIERVVDSGTYIGGTEVERFESEFAASVGAKHCVAVGNGLDAIRLLLEAHGIGAGDEVIVPGFTFYATWLAVLQVGATPVAVDVKLEDASIDPTKIQDAVSPQTKAILVVHLFGISADMKAINKIAKSQNLLVFEDCAQAHSGVTNDGAVGNSSNGGAFSFYPTKNLGALGDGGAITVQELKIADTLRSRRSYGVGKSKYEHIDTGWNTRLDSIHAAVLGSLLPRLGSVTLKRRQIAREYQDSLATSNVSVINSQNVNENVFHHFVISVEDRELVQKALFAHGISTDIHYPYYFNSLYPIVATYASAEKPLGDLPNSRLLSESVLSLPIGPWMKDSQISYVASALKKL